MTNLNYYNKLTAEDFDKCTIEDLQYFRKKVTEELKVTNKNCEAYKMIHDNLMKLKLHKPEALF